MKRYIALLLAILLLLSACGQQSTEPTQAPTIAPTEATEIDTQPATQPQTQPATQPTEPTQLPTLAPTQTTESTQPTQVQTVPDTQPIATIPTTPVVTVPTAAPTQSTIAPMPAPTQAPTMPPTEMHTDDGCNHDYQQTYTKAATCTEAGSKKFTCRKCGEVMRQEIPVKDHSYKDATCSAPKTCTGCGLTAGTALGHSYGENHRCIRCGVMDGSVAPESMAVDFVATIRSDEGIAIPGITVTVYTAQSGSASVGSAVTDQKGKATIALQAGSRTYTVKLSNVPEGYQVQESYSFTSAQITINLKTLPVRSDPNDHSKARYEEGDQMMDFTITDIEGKTYNLSQLLRENKLVILDFWYVSCNPCKQEFPYFEAALEAYGDDVVLLAIDPFYSASDIQQLRDEMGLTFPLFQDQVGLSGGFRVEAYPTTVFIDSTGTIRKIHRKAFSDEAAFLRAVAAYL